MAKLRTILLLEEDFDVINKITHRSIVFPRLEACRVIPYEAIGGRRGQYSQNISLNNNLVCDVGNQTRRPTVVTSTDATNSYDRMAHLVSRITNMCFEMQIEHLIVLFAST